MKRKIFLISAYLLLFLCFMTACKRSSLPSDADRQETQNRQDMQETVCVPAFTEIDCAPEDEANWTGIFRDIFVEGDRLYAVFTSRTGGIRKDNAVILNLDTGEESRQELGYMGEGFYKTEDGFIDYCASTKQIRIYDSDFIKEKEIDISGLYDRLKAEGIKLSCDEMAMDRHQTVGIISGDTLIFIDGEGELLFCFDCAEAELHPKKLAVTENGEWYVFCRSVTKYEAELYYIDMDGQHLGEKMENIPHLAFGISVYALLPAQEDGLFIVAWDKLYLYDTKTVSFCEVFNMRDYGIDVDEQSGFGLRNENDFSIVNMMKEKGTLELAVFEEKPKEEVQLRKEVVIATYMGLMSNFEWEAITRFNRYNREYYVTVKSYWDMYDMITDSQERVRLASQSFYNDLLAGKGSDIFAGTSRNQFENLAEKGGFADLYEFMETDEELKREDFIPNILTALEYNGKLLAVTPNFFLRTIVGKASVLNQYEKWDFDAVYNLVSEHPDTLLLEGETPESLLHVFFKYSMDSFYNMDTGECSFASDEFVRMLKTAASLPEETGNEEFIANRLQRGEVLLYEDSILDFDYMQLLEAFFGEDMAYVGYPSNAKSGTLLSYYTVWAVLAQADNKEGAWEFIKSLFEEDYQKSCGYFPVIRQYLEEELETAMKEQDTASIQVWGQPAIPLEKMSEEQAETFRELVYSATLTNDYDEAVYNIVMEEAQSFFAGDKSAEEAAAVIQDRVISYVEEQR